MAIIIVGLEPSEWLAAPWWQRDVTNSGRLMLVARNPPNAKLESANDTDPTDDDAQEVEGYPV